MASMWSDLPLEISSLIMERLFGKDIASFRAVCAHWRSTPTSEIKRINDPVSEIVKHPFLFRSPSHTELYSPAYNKFYLLEQEQVLRDAQFHCFNHGWLLLSRVHSFFFLHPTSQSIINLPHLQDSDADITSFNRMSFSAPPTSPDCLVFGLVDMFEDHVFIAYIRRGETSWKQHYGFKGFPNKLQTTNHSSSSSSSSIHPCFEWPSYRSTFVYHNGAFYSLGKNGALGVCNPKKKPVDMWRILDTPHNAFMFDEYCEAYLMESPQKELMSVVVGSKGNPVRIVKFNHDLQKWQSVSSLNHQVIFLSHPSCLVIDSKELQVKGFANTVHFPRFHGNYNVFYSLSSKKFHTFEGGYASEDLCDTRLVLNSTWMIPDFQLFSDQQLHWWTEEEEEEEEGEGEEGEEEEEEEEEEEGDAKRHIMSHHPLDFFRDRTFLPWNSKRVILGEETSSTEGGGKPWIICSCEIEEEQVHMLIDLSTRMSYKSDNIEERLRGKEVLGCNDGRLLMMDPTHGDAVVLDASSMTIHPLPTFNDISGFVFRCCLLHLSSEQQDSNIVVIMFGHIDRRNEQGQGEWCDGLAFTSRIGDSKWTRLEGDFNVLDAAFYEGRIYGITITMEDQLSDIQVTPEYIANVFENIQLPRFAVRGSENISRKLVESCGQLLFFEMYFSGSHFAEMYFSGSHFAAEDIVTKIKVYRVDVKTRKLEELHNLGDRAFFFCSWMGGFGCNATRFGFKKNCIYFINKFDNKLQRYDYEDKSVSFSLYYPDMKEDCIKNKFVMYF